MTAECAALRVYIHGQSFGSNIFKKKWGKHLLLMGIGQDLSKLSGFMKSCNISGVTDENEWGKNQIVS